MRRRARWSGVLVGALAVLAAAPARAEGPEVGAKAALERLKRLAGSWNGEVEGHGAGAITYRVTGGGSVVMETFFPGTDHEMVSMYHLDGDDLLMTHYCALGNQPRLKLDRGASTADELVFVFDGGTNLDPAEDMHIHSGRITFRDEDAVDAAWDGYRGGAKVATTRFTLNRDRPRSGRGDGAAELP